MTSVKQKTFTASARPGADVAATNRISRLAGIPHGKRAPKAEKAPDIMAQAKEDAILARRKAVESKLVLPSGIFTELLDITRQALNKAVHDKRIFFVEVGGVNYYPAFYGDPDLQRRDAEQVTKALGILLGWQKWQFFTTPKASLGGLTPIETLKKGQIEKTVIAARGFAER